MALLSLQTMLRVFVWFANRTEKAKSLIRGDRTVQLQIEGEKPCYVQLSPGKISFHDGEHDKPDVILRAKLDNIFKMLSGEVGQEEAFAFKKIEVSGSIVDAVRFNQVAQAVWPSSGLFGKLAKGVLRILR
jgi:putative sterol carrier protein